MKTEENLAKFVEETIEKFKNEHGKDLKISYATENLPLTREMTEFINLHWIRAKKKWPGMFNGKLYHVLRKEIMENEILITTIDSNYKEYVGTRKPKFAKLFDHRYVVNPLSVGALVITSDNKLLLGKRKNVDIWEGFYSTVAGYVQIPESPRSPPDVMGALKQELFQEAAIDENEISDSQFLGTVGKSYLIFEINIHISSSTMVDRQPMDKEFVRFEFLQSDREFIKRFIEHKRFKIMPECLASLIFFGIRHFGENWAASLR
jgi:hypothetical protein